MTQLRSTLARPRRTKMSYEQFLEWDGENQHVEWVNGEVVPKPQVTDEHTDVGVFLLAVVPPFVHRHNLGEIMHSPFQMKTRADLAGRAPDIFFILKSKLRHLHRMFFEGAADLVIEIISPGSRIIDRVDKFREYESGGVREYWLIDPERRRAEFYRRGRDGRFHAMAVEDGIFRSLVLKGLWLRIDWLWHRPDLVAVLKEWELV